jgi:hypothetical protein
MLRTGIFAILLFLGSALAGFIPPLVYLITGWKMNPTLTWDVQEFSAVWVQVVVLICLVSVWALLFKRGGKVRTPDEESRTAAGFLLLFLYLGYTLQSFQAQVLSYRLAVPPFHPAIWVYLGAGLVFLVMFIKPPKEGGWPLIAAMSFLVVLTPFYVRSFPLGENYSDMFSAILSTGKHFLQGHSPYSVQEEFRAGYHCCYWPGIWLSFLPAVVLNIDPRFLVTLFSLVFAFMVWRGMERQDRLLGSWFLALFFLNPWFILRLDVYFSAYLLSWGMFFLALRKGRNTLAARWYGWGLACHPFSWLLLPIWLAWSAKRRGFREARKDLFNSLGVAAIFILPFVAWDPRGFFEGIVWYWLKLEIVIVSHFGLVVWLRHWPLVMDFLVLVFLGLGTWAVWRGNGSLDSLFKWLAATMALALLASFHIEHYYYFVPFSLMIFYEIVRPKEAGDSFKAPSKSTERFGA